MRDPIEEFRLSRPSQGPGSRPAAKREPTGETVPPESLLPDFLVDEQTEEIESVSLQGVPKLPSEESAEGGEAEAASNPLQSATENTPDLPDSIGFEPRAPEAAAETPESRLDSWLDDASDESGAPEPPPSAPEPDFTAPAPAAPESREPANEVADEEAFDALFGDEGPRAEQSVPEPAPEPVEEAPREPVQEAPPAQEPVAENPPQPEPQEEPSAPVAKAAAAAASSAKPTPPAKAPSKKPTPKPVEQAAKQPAQEAAPAAPEPKEGAEGAKQGDLSTPAMLRLMRLELDRAQRHKYPLTCLVIGLDGFDEEDEQDQRKALMPAIFKELKVVCVKNDVRGLGTWSPAFQMAVFPHVQPDDATELAKALMERVRCLRLRMADEVRHATISVGLAHNMRQGGIAFEDLLDDAEAGLRLAESKGGDRCIQFRQVEDDVDDLREELLEKAQELRAQQQSYFEEKASVEDKWGRELLEKVMSVFQSEDDVSETSMRLEQKVLEVVGREVDSLRENSNLRALAESQHQIELLERRLTKLTQSLERTEEELKRVASMKVVGDDGIASIYRSVQGLSDDDANSEAKREMMKDIFAANLDFQTKRKAQTKKSA